MNMIDIIQKTRNGRSLTDEEIGFLVGHLSTDEVTDYQLAAWLMAVYFRGLTPHETAVLTDRMARSGDMVNLSTLSGVTADKHSTGGVGDKTSLIVAPIVAACGVTVAKMSGRGLGHTGGTIDKLEAIPGFRTALGEADFLHIARDTGLCIAGQTGELAPADKVLYALRHLTATIESRPLIAASIMSKKLAAGADVIVLDVKVGSGAFMKTPEDAEALAKTMVDIGTRSGRRMAALLTDMNRPLGQAIGNAPEVREAIETLRGHGPDDLRTLCIELSATMLTLAGKGTPATCRSMAQQALDDGAALQKFRAMVEAQGGNPAVTEHAALLPFAKRELVVRAPQNGFIVRTDTERYGHVALLLGAGRLHRDDALDYGAGLLLHKKTGDAVREGEPLCTLYTTDGDATAAAQEVLAATEIGKQPPQPQPLILGRVTMADVSSEI